VSVELARRLIAQGAVGHSQIRAALREQVVARISLAQALLSTGALSEQTLEQELASAGVPVLASVIPVADLARDLPPGLCRMLLAVPVRRDPRAGTVDLAAVDPFDPHVAEEFSFHLRCQVRVLRAPFSLVANALQTMEKGEVSRSVIVDVGGAAAGPDAAAGALRHGLESNPPIPLVRRSRGVEAIGQLQEADIIEQTGSDQVAMDDRGQPILALRHSKVPKSLATPGPFGRRAGDGPPPTARGPFSPETPDAPFDDVEPALDAMQAATTRDEVMDALIRGMSAVARGVGLFAIRNGAFRGIKCNRKLCNPIQWRQVAISVGKSTVLAETMDAGSYLGPVPDDPDHAPLLSMIGRTGGEVALAVVRVSRRPVLLVLADDLEDTLIATHRADQLTRAAGEALSRILREGKESMRP
jgi:hypothetical protein